MENLGLVLKASTSNQSTLLLPTDYITPQFNGMGSGTSTEERKRGKFREN